MGLMIDFSFPHHSLHNHSVLVDLSLFPEVKNQGLIPMCASVAVADLFSFHYLRLFKKPCNVDCLHLHEQVCKDSSIPPSARLDGVLSLWKNGLITASSSDQIGKLETLNLNMIERIESTSSMFEVAVKKEIDSGNPVILDMPLMISAID